MLEGRRGRRRSQGGPTPGRSPRPARWAGHGGRGASVQSLRPSRSPGEAHAHRAILLSRGTPTMLRSPGRQRFRYELPLHPRHRRVRTVPAGDRHCGWIETLPPLPPARRLTSHEKADCAVIGAGFTGLACARRLAKPRPGWRIAVVDAYRAGDGASGRSRGSWWTAPTSSPVWSRRRAGGIAISAGSASMAPGRRCSGMGSTAPGMRRGGSTAPPGRRGPRRCPICGRGWRAWASRMSGWMPPGLARITGTAHYRAGIRLPGSVLVQAAALARGLAAALLPNVELFESRRCERSIAATFPAGDGFGSIAADRLFLAANGCTPALGFLRRRVFPLFTFGSLTRPLTLAEQEALGGEREWGLLAEDAMGSTVRRTRDQRILIRNSAHYAPASPWTTPAGWTRGRCTGWPSWPASPMLRQVEFEHTWGGIMGVSPNRGHSFGEARRGSVRGGRLHRRRDRHGHHGGDPAGRSGSGRGVGAAGGDARPAGAHPPAAAAVPGDRRAVAGGADERFGGRDDVGAPHHPGPLLPAREKGKSPEKGFRKGLVPIRST